MSKTNCINCGAAKDTDEIKCPFCGTTYVDLTAIDFSSREPVVCQFVLPKQFRYGDSKEKVAMSMLAFPFLDEISMTYDDAIDVTSLGDKTYRYIPGKQNINVNISFIPIEQANGQIFSIKDVR